MQIEAKNTAGSGLVDISLSGIPIPLLMTPAVARQIAATLIEQADRAEALTNEPAEEPASEHDAALAKLREHIAEHGEVLRGASVHTMRIRAFLQHAAKDKEQAAPDGLAMPSGFVFRTRNPQTSS